MRSPSDTVRRRRIGALGVAGFVALLVGFGVGARGEEESEQRPERAASVAPPPAAREAVARLTPAQQAGQVVVLRFRGTSAPPYVLRALRARRVAGVILFRDNIVSPGQLRTLTRSLQRAAGGRALIMTDQEGDPVRRVPWAGPPPQRTLRTAGATRASARAAGRTLRAAGINVDLAPVADDARPGSALAGRRFGGDPSALTAASVKGFADAGVLASAKHFPGLGPARANTDFAAATVSPLAARDLRPFKAAIAADVPLIMAAHALYPQLDRSRIASQSRAILTGLLRGRLRFRGAVITDSLEAQAVVRRSSTPVAASRSLRAGADLLLTTGRGSYLPVLRRLIADARRSAAFRARLREAAARVRALRD